MACGAVMLTGLIGFSPPPGPLLVLGIVPRPIFRLCKTEQTPKFTRVISMRKAGAPSP